MAKYNPQMLVVLRTAHEAAHAASAAYLAEHGEPEMNCGFAWVNVIPARGPFVTAMKAKIAEAEAEARREARALPDCTTSYEERCARHARQQAERQYGSRDDYAGGWQFWAPGDYLGGHGIYQQDMSVKFAGANAFAKSLSEAGLVALPGCRLD